jgi:CRP-like cAMP-binding protein
MELDMPRGDLPRDPTPLVSKLESIVDLSDAERQALMSLPMALRTYADRQDLVREGERSRECCLILDGFACRYQTLPDGRRQILAFHTPGDMPDLQSLHLGIMDHSIASLATTSVAFIRHGHMRDLTLAYPGLLHAFWRDTLIDAAIFRAWLVRVGRRTAHERIAHLLCEMTLRFQAVGLARNHTYEMPVTQADLGDALGLTSVHVNRVLQDMRRDELITWHRSTIRVLRWQAFQDLCSFDPTYLHIKPQALA